jgi:hypothetical protein
MWPIDEQRLLDLNRLTFDAEARPREPIEGQPWDAFLLSVLTDNFIGRRADVKLPNQKRDAFLAFARTASASPRIIVGEPTIWVNGDVGVVACDVRLGDDDTMRFRNVKVFTGGPDWCCAYWQVTSFKPSAS